MEISLTQCAAKPPKGAVLVNLPLSTIHVLRQMRKTFVAETIGELAKSIKAVGQLNQGIVVALDEKDAASYVRAINKTWKTSYSISKFSPVLVKGKGAFYFFLVAGERRYRACKQAESSAYYCQLRFGMHFSDAIILQVQENLHEAVPQEEEAAMLALLWRTEKATTPDLRLSTFARRIGKTSDAIRKSVRFVDLPISVQKLVLPTKHFKKGVSYAILCELARLREACIEYGKPLTVVELTKEAYTFVVGLKTARAAAVHVTQRIEQLEQIKRGARPLFELEIQDVTDAVKRNAASGFETILRSGQQHFLAVARFHGNSAIGKVASQAATTAVTSTLAMAQDLAPEILLAVKGAKGARAAKERLA